MQLVSIDTNFGLVTPIPSGSANQLGVKAMAFAPMARSTRLGVVSRTGSSLQHPDCNPSAPGFNTLYTVDVNTGDLTPVGSGTGAPEYFMDLAFDRNGNLFGETSTLTPAYPPAVLYRIDPATREATRIVSWE